MKKIAYLINKYPQISQVPMRREIVAMRELGVPIECITLRETEDRLIDEADIREKANEMKLQWQAEKDKITAVSAIKEQIEQAHRELEQAQRGADLQRAAELRHGRIPELERELAAAE